MGSRGLVYGVPKPSIHIDETNWQEFAPSQGVVNWGGHQRFCSAKWGKPNSTLPRLPANFQTIPRDEVPSRARDLWQAEATLVHRFRRMAAKNGGKPITKDQDGLSYCHAFCTTSGIEITRDIQGESYVELSPSFIGNIITNFSNSGAYIEDDLECAAEYGAPSVEFVPECSLSRDWYTKNREATIKNAALHRITGFTSLGYGEGMAERMWTCLLQGWPVVIALNWWSHAILSLAIDDSLEWWDLNSWGTEYGDDGIFTLSLGRGTADAAWVPTACVASLV